jgi:hypothetical protein
VPAVIDGTVMFVANCLTSPEVSATARTVFTSVLAPELTLKLYVPTTSPDWTTRQRPCDSVNHRQLVTRDSNQA